MAPSVLIYCQHCCICRKKAQLGSFSVGLDLLVDLTSAVLHSRCRVMVGHTHTYTFGITMQVVLTSFNWAVHPRSHLFQCYSFRDYLSFWLWCKFCSMCRFLFFLFCFSNWCTTHASIRQTAMLLQQSSSLLLCYRVLLYLLSQHKSIKTMSVGSYYHSRSAFSKQSILVDKIDSDKV